MSIILDLILVAIIIFFAFVSYKHGFVRTLVEVAGFIAAIILATSFGTVAAEKIYDKAIEPKIITTTADFVDGTTQNAIDKCWDNLPKIVQNNADKLGITKDKISNNLDSIKGGNALDNLNKAIDKTVRPPFIKVIGMICTLLFFLIFTFIVKILAKLINKVFSFSIIGKLNKTLGGIIGMVKGSIFAGVFCLIIGFLVSVTGGFLIFTNSAIEGTILFKFLLSLLSFS